MTITKSAPSADEANHLWPSMTKSAPSRRALVLIITGFEPACSGSVMAKALRIEPLVSGRRKISRCSSEPCRSSSSMLPISGAWQLKAKWPRGVRPSSSLTRAKAVRVSPNPPHSRGRGGAHRPDSFTRARQTSSAGISSRAGRARNVGSSGSNSRSTKACT